MTPAGASFATSTRTVADLRRLAEQSPAEAQTYLQDVKQRLGPEQRSTRQAIDEILAAAGDLSERIAQHTAQLGLVFAPQPDAQGGIGGALQDARAHTVGWSAVDVAPQPTTYLKGTVRLENGAFFLDSPGRRPLRLAEGSQNDSFFHIPGQWMQGMIGDGPMRLKGKLGADGLTFNVEAFALDRDGRYEKFTAGRVIVEGGDFHLQTTMDERVEISDPALRAQFQGLHKLAVILPGEPELIGGKQVYAANPDQYFAVARFTDPAARTFDMAHEGLHDAVLKAPDAQLTRANHTWRIWFEGHLTVAADGKRTGFEASYLSRQTDTSDPGGWVPNDLPPRVQDAGSLDAARELAAPA